MSKMWHAPQSRRPARWPALTTLRARLIVPYVLLTLLVAVIGTYIATRLAVSSARERFVNQLYEAGRVAADGAVRRERVHLSDLRLMAFTEGVPAALAARDADQLKARLLPLLLNNNVQVLTALDQRGQEILTLARDPQTGQYLAASGADFSGFEPAARVLRGEVDPQGDKFAGFLNTRQGPFLLTAAPVRRPSDNQLVGALLEGTRVESLLVDLKTQALADITVLDLSGQFVASTFARPDEGYAALTLTPAAIPGQSNPPARELALFGRRFTVVDEPLIVRQQVVGVLSAALPSDYIVEAENTSRNLISLIFALLTAAVVVLGLWLAQSIARPILRLRAMSQAVAGGDLNQQTGLRDTGEIGELAGAFDTMTLRLRERTQEADSLYAESVQRNQELAEMYAQLRSTQQQLVQSEKLSAIGQLTAGIVHDVKNPLAVILGLAELMDDDPRLDAAARENMRLIRDNVKRANRIVNDLMRFARQSQLEMTEGDLCAAVETVVRLTSYLAREAHVKVETDLTPEPLVAVFDPQLIEQVLVNLIQNSLQAMPNGGTLRLAVQPEGDQALITVQDTGIGIPPENLSRIFDPFFTTKPVGEGTGLGLAVTYGIITNHGGRITVESVVDQGTTFFIHLPVLPPIAVKEAV